MRDGDKARCLAALINPVAIAVYQRPDGYWVKHFFGAEEALQVPAGAAGVRWFEPEERLAALAYFDEMAGLRLRH